MTITVVTHVCINTMSKDFDSYGEEIPCTGQRHSDGTFTGGCGEPCRWIMIKCGEGKPPWTDWDSQITKISIDTNIQEAFIFENGMIMVFDTNGEQLPEYQGHKNEKLMVLIAAMPETATLRCNVTRTS